MKLTPDLKNKIDNYFDGMTPEELAEKAKEYGMEEIKNLVPDLKETNRVFDGYFKVDEDIFTIKKEDGSEVDVQRLRLNRPDAVAVLVYNEDKGTFVFVRQFRPAIRLKNDSEPIIEIPAGIVDPGETPEEAAAREVKEEAGYELKSLELLQEYYPGVGYCSEKIFVYLANVTEVDKVEEGGGLEIEGEMLEVTEISVEQSITMLDSSQFVDGKTILSLNLFKNNAIEKLVDQQDQMISDQEQQIKDLQTKIALLENKPTV